MKDSIVLLNSWANLLIERDDYINSLSENDKKILFTIHPSNDLDGIKHFIGLIKNEFVNCICPRTPNTFLQFLRTALPELTPTNFNATIIRCSSYVHMLEKNISALKETSPEIVNAQLDSYWVKSYLAEIKLVTDSLFHGMPINEFIDSLYENNPDDNTPRLDSVIIQEVQNFLIKY